MNKKISVIIMVIIIILILLCGGIAGAYFFTDIFKTDKEMFFKYISENAEILDVLQDEDLEKYAEKQQNTAYTTNGSITINDSTISDLGENELALLNNSNITFSSNVDASNNYTYKRININYSDTETLSIEYANVQDYYGIKIDDVLNKFIAVENNNLKAFATMLELDDDIIESIPDKIDFDESTSSELFTDEEKSQLQSTYKNILLENLTDDMFSKSETSEGEIYTLTITESQAETIICKLLEQLKDDDIIFNKIKEIMVESGEYTESEVDNYIAKIKDYIQEYIDEINGIVTDDTETLDTDEDAGFTLDDDEYYIYDENLYDEEYEDDEEDLYTEDYYDEDDEAYNDNLVINIYVSNNSLTKTEVVIGEGKIALTKNSNGFSLECVEDEETDPVSISIEKTKTADTLEYKFDVSMEEGQEASLDIKFGGLSALEQVEENFTFYVASEDDYKLNYTYNNTKNFNVGEISKDVTTDDMIALNTAPSITSIESLFMQIEEKLEEVNSTRMDNLGIEENPMVYYVPAIIPLAIITGMTV